MNLTIFSMVFSEPLPRALFMPLLDKLPANLQQTVLKFRNWSDSHASLLGKHLLTYAMRTAGYAPSLDQLRYTDHRRPYFDHHPDFNISHSGNRVICVVNSQGRVGIDLEVRSALSIDDFKTQFSPTEWTHITNAADPLSVFFHYWTAKESVIKADGRGLSVPLSALEIIPGQTVLLDKEQWFLQCVDIDKDYACHLASNTELPSANIRELTPADLLSEWP